MGKGGRGRDEGCGKWVEPADLPTPHNVTKTTVTFRWK